MKWIWPLARYYSTPLRRYLIVIIVTKVWIKVTYGKRVFMHSMDGCDVVDVENRFNQTFISDVLLFAKLTTSIIRKNLLYLKFFFNLASIK